MLTHSHFDHITGLRHLKDSYPNAKISIHSLEENELLAPPGPINDSSIRFFGELSLLAEVAKQPPADILLNDGDFVFDFKVIHTPGHTPGSICLYSKERNILISGDTIFDYGGYGRTDLYGGSESEIMKSIEKLKKIIPSGTLVYPGHDSFAFAF